MDSAVNVAREYIISEITKKKNTILNEADIDNIKHDINDSTYNDAKKSNDIIKSLNSIIHITRNGMWPSYTYEIKATDNEGKKSVYQNIYFNVVLDIVSSGDTATAPYNIPKQNNELVVTNLRHKEALQDALHSLQLVERSIEDGMPEDFYSIDLTSAYASLGKIIGEEVDEDVVNEIFSKFCMGK